jgi:hypothetical protein
VDFVLSIVELMAVLADMVALSVTIRLQDIFGLEKNLRMYIAMMREYFQTEVTRGAPCAFIR